MLDLKNRLEQTCEIARTSLRESQDRYKHHYDKQARPRSLKPGLKVLVLLPTDHNKLTLQWKGTYEVEKVLNKMDYKVRVGDKIWTYHINLLKRYEERDTKMTAVVSVIDPEYNGNHDCDTGVIDNENFQQGKMRRNIQGRKHQSKINANTERRSRPAIKEI